MKFRLSFDVIDAIYAAVGTTDLTGLGDDGTANYSVDEAHVVQLDASTYEVDIEVEHKSGPQVAEDALADSIIEYFDAELCVDIDTFERA